MCMTGGSSAMAQEQLKTMPDYGQGDKFAENIKVTEQEQRIIDYHRNTIKSGKVGKDEQGRPVTVYATGIEVMEGPQKGKFVSVPAYVDGKIIRNEDQLYQRWKSEIDAGKWPMYKTGQELNKRSQKLHTVMDIEEDQAKSSSGFYDRSKMKR